MIRGKKEYREGENERERERERREGGGGTDWLREFRCKSILIDHITNL